MCIDIITGDKYMQNILLGIRYNKINRPIALITKKVGLVKLRTIKESLQLQ